MANNKSNNSESFFRHLFSGALRGLTDLKSMVSDTVPSIHIGQIQNRAQPGDMLELQRGLCTYYALYLGGGNILSIDVENNQASEAQIRKHKLEEVCSATTDSRSCKIRVSSHEDVAKAIFNLSPKSKEYILRDAMSFVNKTVPYEYDFRNCEYYCTLWRYGKGFSTQAAEEYNVARSNGETSDSISTNVFEAVGYAKYRELAANNEELS